MEVLIKNRKERIMHAFVIIDSSMYIIIPYGLQYHSLHYPSNGYTHSFVNRKTGPQSEHAHTD